METSNGTPGPPQSLGPPGPLGHQGPPVPQECIDSQGPQDLWTLEPQDLKTHAELPPPFEIQNLHTVQLFLMNCRKYSDDVSHGCGLVAFLIKV